MTRSTHLARALPLAAAVAALAAGPAPAQVPAPSLSVDTAFAPPSGIAEYDFSAGTAADVTGGVAVAGERIYTVGETRATTGDANIAILARRPDGTFDPAFGGDGREAVSVAAGVGRDAGYAIAALPDGRLRVLAATDADTTAATNLDVAILGLNPDGSPDQSFGGGDGRVVFPVGTGNDTPTRMALHPSGRIAVTGATVASGKDDTFVSLREPDGSPAAFGAGGVRTFNRAGTASGVLLNDRGVDVAFRPGGGVVALLSVETNPDATLNDWTPVLRAFEDDGDDDPRFDGDGELVLAVGTPDTIPGGLLAHGDRLFVTGSTKTGQDTDAFVARMEADGSGVQSRRFDLRGRSTSTAAVTSQGNDLDVVPGLPATLVVGGFVTSETATTWGAAALNGIDGDLSAAGLGDIVMAIPGQGSVLGVAAGPGGWAAVGGSLLDSSTADTSLGTAKLLVDADKACDLVLEITRPLEMVFEGARPVTLTARVTNAGTRTCGGTLSGPSTYPLTYRGATGPVAVGPIAPGGSATLEGIRVDHRGARKAVDLLNLQLSVTGDANPADNVVSARVRFAYCDLRLMAVGALGLLPSEGSRAYEFSVRNVGTADCSGVRVAVTRGGRRVGAATPYRVASGKAVTDEVVLAATTARTSRPATVGFRAVADEDVDSSNDLVTLRPAVVRVGDSRITSASARGVRGTATGGRGRLAARRLRVSRVQVAIRRLGGKGCRWVAARSGRLKTVKGASCGRMVWLTADGTRAWRLSLSRALPAGRYAVHSRATIATGGFHEGAFSTRDGNRALLRVAGRG